MASDLDKITQAFRLLASVAFPDGYIGELEVAALNAHLEATKADRAKHLLATRGRKEAAAILGCSEAQVYRLAQIRKSSAPIESAA
jgi:hypothetical protein